MNTLWLKNPLAVHQSNAPDEPDAAGGIVVDTESGTIVEILGAGHRPARPPEDVFDAGEHVITPGLINTHHHFYQTLTRAWPPVADSKLFDWLAALYPVWARIDGRALRLATKLGMAELLESGCTTTADHHYVFPAGRDVTVDAQVEVARELGMRAVLTRGSMSMGEDEGGLPPRHTVQDPETILSDSARLVDSYHERGDGAMIQIALAPCSPFSVSSALMTETAALAQRLDVRLHTHLGETLDEEEYCQEQLGMRPVDYLESVGWLTGRTWLAHGVHFRDEEITRLGNAGTAVAHCPTSNMRLASGIARAVELDDAGAPVGIGVDGSASNDCSNMIREVRQALYLQRLPYGAEAVSTSRALNWATAGSAAALGRGDIGTIAIGRQADLALFRPSGPAFSGSHDPLTALLLCGIERADRVLVAGRWRVLDGHVVDLDTDALIAHHQEAANALMRPA